MRVGVDLPYFQDPAAIRDYAQAAEELGFDHIGYSEHVAASRRTDFPPLFSFEDPWHESFTLGAFLAAVTREIELNPSMLLLPLRQPVLAAKQAAEVDLLSGGRLRLAVSAGWNREECVALGVDPASRGERLEEQVEILRRLWSEEAVTFRGRFHELNEVGIHPRPGRPIPIWMGGGSLTSEGVPPERVLRRAARVADGFKLMAPLCIEPERGRAVVERARGHLREYGRGEDGFGIEARIVLQESAPDEWVDLVELWKRAGVSHLGASNRIAGGGVDEQIERVARFAELTRAHW